jgi:histidine triad (HIT) family protein
MTASESIFTKIINRDIPAEILFENDRVIAIRDIAPQAPVHLLVIPKSAESHNLATLHANGEYRLVFNSGETVGQTVFHVHAHVLSGGLQEHTLA